MSKEICCRICWNTNGWMKPALNVTEVEKGNSYGAQHKFGFEEWLFDFSMVDSNGHKYGFLQPIYKNSESYSDKILTIYLYTISPKGRYFVGSIKNCLVLNNKAWNKVYTLYKIKGWLNRMKKTMLLLNLDAQQLDNEKKSLFNVKFKQEDVVIFNPLTPVPLNHKIYRMDRYQVLLGGMKS